MSACTDTFGFNRVAMFEEIRGALPGDCARTQNLIESKDDVLFVWNSKDCSLLALNWRMAKVKGNDVIKHQTLQPSKLQNFVIDRILCAPDSDLVALSGPRGLCLLELPRRWGPNGQYLEGKDHIICRSQNVDVQFFVNNAPLELLQIRWHPASPTGTHIMALISDNTIRVYDESTLKHVWRVGPVPSMPIPSATSTIAPVGSTVTSDLSLSPSVASSKAPFSHVPLLNSLGETAVDFDIAPPRVVSLGSDNVKNSRIINATTYVTDPNDNTYNTSETSLAGNQNGTNKNSAVKDKVEWPIVILRGNGNIYILCASIDTSKPRLQGPLTIQPQVTDNYGVDSCSILVIPSLPPTVVIAECTGKLYNGLLLEAETAEESFHEVDSSLVIYPSEWTIHILETVELELGLPDTNKNRSHSCLIHLKRDVVNELRFFAYHNTGLHVVMLNFIKQLQHFVESEDVSLTSLNVSSKSEYLICTKALQTGKINPVLGFTLFEMPSGILTLLGSGQVLSLNLISDPCLLPSWDPPAENKSSQRNTSDFPLQKIMSESFVTYIRNILKSTLTQPLLSLDKSSEPAAQEAHALLQQAIQVLKDQYFSRHEKARVEIVKRVNILKRLKEQQQKEVELLELEKEKIRDNAEQLAEKYEDICDKQQTISRKCQELINKANVFLPHNTISDKDFVENVEKINEATKKIQLAIEQAKKKINNQRMHIHNFMESGELKQIDLPPKQEKTIKEIISRITMEIECQIKEIKRINRIINL